MMTIVGGPSIPGTAPAGPAGFLFGQSFFATSGNTGAAESAGAFPVNESTIITQATDLESALASLDSESQVGAVDSAYPEAILESENLVDGNVAAQEGASGDIEFVSLSIDQASTTASLESGHSMGAIDSETLHIIVIPFIISSLDSTQQAGLLESANTIDSLDAETHGAINESELGIDSQDSSSVSPINQVALNIDAETQDDETIYIINPGTRLKVIPHGMRTRTGRQISYGYKETDTAPSLIFRFVDETLGDIPIMGGSVAYFRLSDVQLAQEILYQILTRIGNSNDWRLLGSHLAGVPVGEYMAEVEIFYGGVLQMTSETINFEITANLDY